MDAIANHIWQSTIVGLAAAVLALMLRNNGASVRYWIWFAAAMKFLVPFAALTAAANVHPAAAGAVGRDRRARCRHSDIPLVDNPGARRHVIDLRHHRLAAGHVGCRYEVGVAMAASGRRCPSVATDGRRRCARHAQTRRARGRHQQPHGTCGVESLDRAWRARHPNARAGLAQGSHRRTQRHPYRSDPRPRGVSHRPPRQPARVGADGRQRGVLVSPARVVDRQRDSSTSANARVTSTSWRQGGVPQPTPKAFWRRAACVSRRPLSMLQG